MHRELDGASSLNYIRMSRYIFQVDTLQYAMKNGKQKVLHILL